MRIGLVLAGGGARGAYQIGAWKALKELQIDQYIEVVSGTSIGALNALLFMLEDITLAEEIWCKITKEEILPSNHIELSFRELLLKFGMKNVAFVKKYIPRVISGGNISRESLKDIMGRLDFNAIYNSKKKCYVTCTQLPELIPKYFNIANYDEKTAKSILCATSAIPIIYECETIDEIQYLDGAIVDNVPIQVAYGEHCDIIIVIHLSKESSIDKRNFPNTSIIEIIPSIIEDGDFDGIFEFSEKLSKRRMQIGYEDVINTLKPIMKLTKIIEKENSQQPTTLKG